MTERVRPATLASAPQAPGESRPLELLPPPPKVETPEVLEPQASFWRSGRDSTFGEEFHA
jgi:hypothetical protein